MGHRKRSVCKPADEEQKSLKTKNVLHLEAVEWIQKASPYSYSVKQSGLGSIAISFSFDTIVGSTISLQSCATDESTICISIFKYLKYIHNITYRTNLKPLRMYFIIKML